MVRKPARAASAAGRMFPRGLQDGPAPNQSSKHGPQGAVGPLFSGENHQHPLADRPGLPVPRPPRCVDSLPTPAPGLLPQGRGWHRSAMAAQRASPARRAETKPATGRTWPVRVAPLTPPRCLWRTRRPARLSTQTGRLPPHGTRQSPRTSKTRGHPQGSRRRTRRRGPRVHVVPIHKRMSQRA